MYNKTNVTIILHPKIDFFIFAFMLFNLMQNINVQFKIISMKRIKSFLAVCLFSMFFYGTAYSQNLEAAVELYNNGGKALSSNEFSAAADSFNKALKMLESLSTEDRGEEGDVMINEIKNILPQLHLRYAKDLANQRAIDKAIDELNIAKAVAKEYDAQDVIQEVSDLIPQLLLVDASNLLNDGKLDEAIKGFQKVIKYDSTNSAAYLRMGLAQLRKDDEEAALQSFTQAMELGETDNSPRQIAVIYLKKAAAALRTKNWNQVYENAKKSNQYSTSANANKLIGVGAVQLKRYDEAIAAIESYLAEQPNASDKMNMIYQLAVSFEGKGDNAKACGYYKQLLNDPTYKQIAEYKVNTQLKCN